MATQFEAAKWVPGTHFLVDGFRHTTSKCKNYFLTHAHADHTTGLHKSWLGGTIHCTTVTARLVVEEAGISKKYVHGVSLNEPFDVEGVQVTALCANHCPGAAMFLFSVPQLTSKPRHILHTGDFRFHPRMLLYPALQRVKIHTLFLDTTYSSPKWRFPEQGEAIDQMVEVMKRTRVEQAGAQTPLRHTSHVLT
jgi:DNA cross-link repair 1A protein